MSGGEKYQIKGCAGKGGFAQVYKACVNSNADKVVALKVIDTLRNLCSLFITRSYDF